LRDRHPKIDPASIARALSIALVLAVVGPLLAALGALLLAYDVLTNPGRAQRRETYHAQGERWAAFYKSFYEKYKDAPPGAVRDIAEEYGRQIPVAPDRLAQKKPSDSRPITSRRRDHTEWRV
jgi:hypothetical protein